MTIGTAWLFPGQGSDLAAAPRGALENAGPVRRLLAVAGALLREQREGGARVPADGDLAGAILRGDPAVLRTEIAQPALVAVGLGLAEARAAAGEEADVVAGHSLGELAAVAAAGCLDAEDAIAAAVTRGWFMAQAARAAPGGMAAVRCPDETHLGMVLAEGRRHGALCLAARNSPTQFVLSGDRAALGAALALAPGVLLPVSGPWHSPAMAAAAAAWEPLLRRLPWHRPRRRIALAATATLAGPDEDLAAALAGALVRPVSWVATLQAMRADGIARFVSVGPGRVLAGLLREIFPVGTSPADDGEAGGGEARPS